MIHPTAYVDKTAQIADDAEIGPMAYVGPECIIHPRVNVGAKATVECYTEIGEDTVLSPNAHVGGAPQDIGYKGEPTKLIIGKRNIIREFCTIHRATMKEDLITVVGDDCYLMSGVHIAHDCKIGNSVIMANYATLGGHTQVDDYAFVSGLVGVHQFVRMGTMAMIAALARVGKDIPPYCIAYNDAIVGLNVVAMRRHGVSAAARAEIKKAVKILTDNSILFEDLPAKFAELEQLDEIITFSEFVKRSKRSILRNLGTEERKADYSKSLGV